MKKLAVMLSFLGLLKMGGIAQEIHKTPAPLFRDPIGNKSYIFYFTHPGRKTHDATSLDKDGDYPYSERRSSIQVAELVFRDGTLAAVRDEPFDFWLPDLN